MTHPQVSSSRLYLVVLLLGALGAAGCAGGKQAADCADCVDANDEAGGGAACSDGQDNDGDGKVDYPQDPGCNSALEDSEEDECPGERCPQCADGIDNDGDGKTDYPQDDGCKSAGDPQEMSPDPGACAGIQFEPMPPTGLVTGQLANGQGFMSSTCGGGGGNEKVYEIALEKPQVMVATTAVAGTTTDTVLYVRSRCADPATERACNDNAPGATAGSTLTVSLDAGFYYLVVDGRQSGSVGPFQLRVQFFPGEGEACSPGPDACGPGLVCRALPGEADTTCEPPVCSDGHDDDGDGVADFPGDPGCASPADDSEADDCPSGESCPQCGDGADNDGNGTADYPEDPGCSSAGQEVEGCGLEEDPVVAITAAVTTGTLDGASDDLDLTCDASSGGAREVAHVLQLPVAVETLRVDTTGTSFDSAVQVMAGNCDGTSLGCSDPNVLTLSDVAAGNYVVVVSAWSSSGTGAYTLRVEGTVAAMAACDHPAFASGILRCPTTHPCDGAICAPAACDDGMDNDGDGLADYPEDPGCGDPYDADEADDCPSGPGCPACANDADDDADGQIDFPADSSCSSAAGASEACTESDPILTVTAPTHTGTTVGLTNDHSPGCGTSSAPEQVWMVTLPEGVASLSVTTAGTAHDTILAIKNGDCTGTSLACNDDTGGTLQSAVSLTSPAAGTYSIHVDGYSSNEGPYTLNVSGTLTSGASCTSPLVAANVLRCPTGQTCNGTVCAP